MAFPADGQRPSPSVKGHAHPFFPRRLARCAAFTASSTGQWLPSRGRRDNRLVSAAHAVAFPSLALTAEPLARARRNLREIAAPRRPRGISVVTPATPATPRSVVGRHVVDRYTPAGMMRTPRRPRRNTRIGAPPCRTETTDDVCAHPQTPIRGEKAGGRPAGHRRLHNRRRGLATIPCAPLSIAARLVPRGHRAGGYEHSRPCFSRNRRITSQAPGVVTAPRAASPRLR